MQTRGVFACSDDLCQLRFLFDQKGEIKVMEQALFLTRHGVFTTDLFPAGKRSSLGQEIRKLSSEERKKNHRYKHNKKPRLC